MTRAFSSLAATCFLLLTLATAASAADVPRAALSGDTDQLVAEGWTETAPGVYQRSVDGSLQILAYGDAGPRLELGWIETQIETLTVEFEKHGSADTAQALQDLELRRDDLLDALRESTTGRRVDETDLLGRGDVSDQDLAACDLSISYDATAGTTPTGPKATATVTFEDSCGRDADLSCYTLVRGYLGTQYTNTLKTDIPDTVSGSGSCSVVNEITADNNCFANASAQLSFNDDAGNPVTLIDRDSNPYCRTFEVEAVGGDYRVIYIAYGQCVTTQFQATSNRDDVTYLWDWDYSGSVVGQTYNKTLCNNTGFSGGSMHTLFLKGYADTGEFDDQYISVEVRYTKYPVAVE